MEGEAADNSQEQQLVDLRQQLFTAFFTTERNPKDRSVRFSGVDHVYIPPGWTDTVFDVNTLTWQPTVEELNAMPEQVGKLADYISGGTRRTASFTLRLVNRDQAGLLPSYKLSIAPAELTGTNAGVILSDDSEEEMLDYNTARDRRTSSFDEPVEGRPEIETLRRTLSQRETRASILIPATKWAINCLNNRKVTK